MTEPGRVLTPEKPRWKWWERWTLVVDFPLGEWRVAPRGWLCKDTAELKAGIGDLYSFAYPRRDRGKITVVRTRQVIKGDTGGAS